MIREIGSPSERVYARLYTRSPCFVRQQRLADSRLAKSLGRFASRLPFCITRFLNVCVGRKLNTKDRRIRRVSLCSPAYSFRPLCAPPFMQHRPYDYDSLRSSHVRSNKTIMKNELTTDEMNKFIS